MTSNCGLFEVRPRLKRRGTNEVLDTGIVFVAGWEESIESEIYQTADTAERSRGAFTDPSPPSASIITSTTGSFSPTRSGESGKSMASFLRLRSTWRMSPRNWVGTDWLVGEVKAREPSPRACSLPSIAATGRVAQPGAARTRSIRKGRPMGVKDSHRRLVIGGIGTC